MSFSPQIGMSLQIFIAFLLGGLLGWERERAGHEAGIRTFGAIAVGACVFGLISIHGIPAGDPSRIASNVVVGVGFLGAGLIFRHEGLRIAGLTTAATLWCTASVGLAIAYNMYLIALVTTLIIFLGLWLARTPWWKLISAKKNRRRTGQGD